MGDTLAPKGIFGAFHPPGLLVEEPKSYCMKVTSQIFSATSLMPTFCPANTWLKFIFLQPMQMRPQLVTVMVRS